MVTVYDRKTGKTYQREPTEEEKNEIFVTFLTKNQIDLLKKKSQKSMNDDIEKDLEKELNSDNK